MLESCFCALGIVSLMQHGDRLGRLLCCCVICPKSLTMSMWKTLTGRNAMAFIMVGIGTLFPYCFPHLFTALLFISMTIELVHNTHLHCDKQYSVVVTVVFFLWLCAGTYCFWHLLDLSWTSSFGVAQVVGASDAMQYFVGKEFGKTKIFRYSPKKTLEGYIGGTIGAWMLACLMAPSHPPFHLFGLLLAGILGDALQSGWKRCLDIKDASAVLASHGGFLDRLDSHVASAVYIYITGYNGIHFDAWRVNALWLFWFSCALSMLHAPLASFDLHAMVLACNRFRSCTCLLTFSPGRLRLRIGVCVDKPL